MDRLTPKDTGAHIARGFISVSGTLIYPLLSYTFPAKTILDKLDAGFLAPFAPAVIALAVVAGALLIVTRPAIGRTLITTGLTCFAVVAVWTSGVTPMAVFRTTILYVTAIMSVRFVTVGVPISVRRRFAPKPLLFELRGACIGALLVWSILLGTGLLAPLDGRISAIVAFSIVIVIGTRGFRMLDNISILSKWWIVGLVACSVVAAMLTWQKPVIAITFLVPIAILGLSVLRERGTIRQSSAWWEDLLTEPYRLMFFSFFGTCLVGGLLLSMPISWAFGKEITVLDALFTAVSATCVTGLAVLDTAGDFSRFGQGVILLLIQIGGLGIMTFSTAAMVLLGKRLSLRYEGTMSSVIGESGMLKTALRRIVGITLGIELIGASLLFALFREHGDAPGTAAFRGLFTAVSAFCNAGFALQSDSLMGYQHAPAVLHVIASLIVVGGVSTQLIAALPGLLRGVRLSVQHRIVLITTAVLLVVPAIFITTLEWSNTLSELNVFEKITNGWFQAVTPRTAGFNSVDIGAMHPASVTVIEGLMFVGGSPGSTAGGIKTTTMALLILVIFATFRGRSDIVVYGRRIAHRSIIKAVAAALIAAGAVFTGLITLLLTQSMPFQTALFEVISAVGTVGLSIGGTALLDEVGKVIIMVLMFAGRLGPLSLFLLLSLHTPPGKWRYPEQEIHTG